MGMVILAILIIAYIMIGYGLFLSIIIEDYTQNVWKPIICFLWIVSLWFPYGVSGRMCGAITGGIKVA